MKTPRHLNLSPRTAIAAAFIVVVAIAVTLVATFANGKRSFPVTTIREVEELTANFPGRLDPLVVRFISPIADPGALQRAISLKPEQKGSWALRDSRTVEFTPSEPYKSKKSFTLSVDTGVLAGTDEGKRGFTVTYNVRPSEYEISPEGLYAEDGTDALFSFSGSLTTDVPVTLGTAREMVSARLGRSEGGKRQIVEWDDAGKASTAHRFSVRHISRADADQFLTVYWTGSPVGSAQSGKKSWLVPANDDFKVLEIAANDPTCIQVRFSDPVDKTQDMRGLIRARGEANVRYSVDSNVVKLFNTEGWQSGDAITVLKGIKSASGKVLQTEVSSETSSQWEIPEIRFKDQGVILPTSAGVTVPVETKNLTGVIVEAYRIYADNTLQFLQVNELDGTNEMVRVGDPVWSGSFTFNWDPSMKNRFVTRGIDLSPLSKKYPDGMYQIRMTFRKRHIMYECPRGHRDFSDLKMPSDEITADQLKEKSYWDNWEGDWDTRYEYWDYREDPCHPAFYLYDYHNEILTRKNVLISDLGIMIKRDAANEYHVTVADIRTAQPVEGAQVVAWSYAQQKTTTAITDKNGFVNLDLDKDPFVVTATKNGQSSYLKIGDGAALSVSHFAVDGEKPDKGVKGFIYGERGVWRPGDDIHLVFVLQDPENQVPDTIPVNFELQNPEGQVIKSDVYSDNVGGFYRIDTSTSDEDSTGSWTARVSVGGRSWTKALRIEAVVPNRLSIDLKANRTTLRPENNEFTLKGAWLHGAAAPGLKADMSVAFFPADTKFDGYSEYTFTNPDAKVDSELKTVWEGNLDKDSTARFSADFFFGEGGDNLPGKLKARIQTRIFEPSEMFSVEQADYDFAPYDRYVGIRLPKGDATRGMLLTDTKHRVDIAVLDPEGKPYNDAAQINIALYKVEWRWWWEQDALTGSSYSESESERLISQGTVTAKNGRATWEFEVKYPDWGRYVVIARDARGGHSASKFVYIDWPGWAGRGKDAGTGSAAMLPLTADRSSYKTGDIAQVSFSSGSDGRALITVERDGRVLRQEWMDTAQGTSIYRLALTSEMTPNAYVHVTLLQKHMQTANNLPIRLYGVIPLMVENPATRLAPVIASADEFFPVKSQTITVSESSGKPMTFTLAIVDEGLLGLTRFKAPNPWNEFYKKEASRLVSWDIYRYVMSAYGGKLETLLSIGGAEGLLNGGDRKANRFKPVVLFFGPYEIKANEKKSIAFDMPEYIGAVRMMVVAGKGGAYGTAEKSVPVRGETMILPTFPRTIGVNETIEVPVTVFNGGSRDETMTVELTATGSISSAQTQKVTVPPVADKTITFRVGSSGAGMATFKVRAIPSSAGLSPIESVTEIDVLSRGSPLVTARRFTLEPGKTYRDFVPSPGEKGSKTMGVELATLPVLDLRTRMQYLLTYPHGCIEQITSGGFPQLFIPSMVQTSADENATIKKNVMSVIERYPRYQTSSGGFAYWPGETAPSEWGSCWAGHFIVEAKKAGYEVPDSVYSPWLAYQKERAQSWTESKDTDSIQAYRLYTLALAGSPDLGAMNRLITMKDASPNARWLLAGAYALAGQQPTAETLVAKLSAEGIAYRESGNTWGSDFRDSAIALNTLSIMKDGARSSELTRKIAEKFGSERWYSTHETGWAILALAPYYSTYQAKDAAYAIEWDKGSVTGTIGAKAVIRDLEPFESPTQTVVVKNTGDRTIFGKVTTRGMIPAGGESAMQNGLAVAVQYINGTGRVITPREMAPGDTFTVQVRVTNLTKKKVDNVALSVPVPTCWEFANDRLGSDTDQKSTLYTYRDIRDTVINTYFNLKESDSKTFTLRATIAYNGNYYVPAIRAEAMYDSDYQAIVPGQLVSRIAGAQPR
ncbi:MAG TPA: alpha-2-macroglobulin family protein [Treponemataceae bacterium]|nr:alpha-2-macroglobulin family protein [Treponemataceae bacterium]